jgi:hypothetical protein
MEKDSCSASLDGLNPTNEYLVADSEELFVIKMYKIISTALNVFNS